MDFFSIYVGSPSHQILELDPQIVWFGFLLQIGLLVSCQYGAVPYAYGSGFPSPSPGAGIEAVKCSTPFSVLFFQFSLLF
jgi:hypothetical protein